MEKYNVIVSIESRPDGKMNVSVGQPQGEEKLTFVQMSHTLAAGISLLIKLVNEKSEKKDHELMREIIEYLNQEFISLISFSDAKIIN